MSGRGLWAAVELDRRLVSTNLALAAVIPLALSLLSGGDDPVGTYVFNGVVGVSVMASIQGLYIVVLPALGVDPERPLPQLVAHLAVVTGGSALGAAVAAAVLLALQGVPFGRGFPSIFRIAWVVSAVVVLVLVILDRLQRRLLDARLAEAEARQSALRAELQALQARTDPHFLFNSLNAVAGLIAEDPEKAEELLERLSSLFRYALTAPSRGDVALAEELEAVRDYLEVQQVRLGDRLTVQVHCTVEAEGVRVPPFVLQPLVENAVQHGVAPRREGGTVAVRAAVADGVLRLEVDDDGPGLGASSHAGTGTSLADLRARLALAYGEAARLEHTPLDPGHRVAVTLPWRTS